MKTRIKNLMRPHPVIISPGSTIAEAARKMEEIDCGVLPVGTDEMPEGIITDRDIVLRVVAKGMDVETETVENHMTRDLVFCNENDSLEKAAKLMHDYQINRLLVKDINGSLSGIITFGCIVRKDESNEEITTVIEKATGKHAA